MHALNVRIMKLSTPARRLTLRPSLTIYVTYGRAFPKHVKTQGP